MFRIDEVTTYFMHFLQVARSYNLNNYVCNTCCNIATLFGCILCSNDSSTLRYTKNLLTSHKCSCCTTYTTQQTLIDEHTHTKGDRKNHGHTTSFIKRYWMKQVLDFIDISLLLVLFGIFLFFYYFPSIPWINFVCESLANKVARYLYSVEIVKCWTLFAILVIKLMA